MFPCVALRVSPLSGGHALKPGNSKNNGWTTRCPSCLVALGLLWMNRTCRCMPGKCSAHATLCKNCSLLFLVYTCCPMVGLRSVGGVLHLTFLVGRSLMVDSHGEPHSSSCPPTQSRDHPVLVCGVHGVRAPTMAKAFLWATRCGVSTKLVLSPFFCQLGTLFEHMVSACK